MLFISIVQKLITGHGTFQQAPTEHRFEADSLLKQMYRVSKNECFFNVKEACGPKKNASEGVNGFHYFRVFVRSWLSLTDLKEEPQTGNKNWLLQSKN